MPLDKIEQQHLNEYYGLLEQLQYFENNTNLSEKSFEDCIDYKIKVIDSLISQLEKKRDESEE